MEKFPKSLNPQTLAKLQSLQLRARHIVEGYVAGLHRSPYHGFSIEFAEHREYAPGDDLRYVDWKAFGRTDKFYLKQFEDETNLICYLALDVSESMRYKSPAAPLSKFEYAQCIAAALSWLVLKQQDSVALAAFDDKIRTYIRPSGHPSHLQEMLHVMESAPLNAKTAAGEVFHDLAERLKKRGVVLILSDLFDDLSSLARGLKHLRHRKHDVIVFQILDPAELEFPFKRPTLFHGLEALPDVPADPVALRKAYLQEFKQFLTAVEKICRSLQVDYKMIRTDQSFETALSGYLASRMSKVK